MYRPQVFMYLLNRTAAAMVMRIPITGLTKEPLNRKGGISNRTQHMTDMGTDIMEGGMWIRFTNNFIIPPVTLT